MHWRRAKRAMKLALLGGAATVIAISLMRVAVQVVPGAGPWLADGLRAVLGVRTVTWLEETSARVEDRIKRLLAPRLPPPAQQQSKPQLQLRPDPPPSPSQPAPTPAEARFSPTDVGPMHRRVAGIADGEWRGVTDPARPEAAPLLFATQLHPDVKRYWAEVFVVVAPVAQVRLHAVAGTVEPEATTRAGRQYPRRGLVPSEHQPGLLAAFNGGFMTKHGQHGMHVDGATLVPAKPRLCTLLALKDGSLQIGTWRNLARSIERAEQQDELLFWRQAAPCLYEAGQLNPALRDEAVKNWGATIDGDVVIRRSAVGLDASRRTLFVGISNDTTARAIADAMHHAGASDVAQLDVNWSYPKFLLFPRGPQGERRAVGLFAGFAFRPDDYVTRPSTRDFFYLVRRD